MERCGLHVGQSEECIAEPEQAIAKTTRPLAIELAPPQSMRCTCVCNPGFGPDCGHWPGSTCNCLLRFWCYVDISVDGEAPDYVFVNYSICATPGNK